jgi:1-acyl-sn-glycerol-3-phosphate acyltransferase
MTAQWFRLTLLGVSLILGWLLVLTASLAGTQRSRRRAGVAMRVSSRMTLRALGIRLDVRGERRSGAGLVVGNHVSWLDILVLTASAPMRQVAKSEVAGWPVVGTLARRSGALFVRRGSLRQLPALVDEMSLALRQGDKVQLFPEATTRCGGSVAEFRRAGFQAAIDAAVVVMPVTLTYRDAYGRQTAAPAFVGDESLLVAIRRVVRVPDLTVGVHWLRPIPAIAGTGQRAKDRARVTTLAESAVARDLQAPIIRRSSRATGPTPLTAPDPAPGTIIG